MGVSWRASVLRGFIGGPPLKGQAGHCRHCRHRGPFLEDFDTTKFSYENPSIVTTLVTRPNTPPYRETGVAIPLSHCVSSGIADYRCYTPLAFHKNGLSQSKDKPNKGASQKKLASEAYRATGGVARDSIANRTIVGNYHSKRLDYDINSPRIF